MYWPVGPYDRKGQLTDRDSTGWRFEELLIIRGLARRCYIKVCSVVRYTASALALPALWTPRAWACGPAPLLQSLLFFLYGIKKV